MTQTNSPCEIQTKEPFLMLNRLLKVAEILTRRSSCVSVEDEYIENAQENHESEEIEYLETKDHLSIA